MKAILKLITLMFITIVFNVEALDIQSNSAILYNTKDDKVLFQKNAEQKVPIASLTNIMTT